MPIQGDRRKLGKFLGISRRKARFTLRCEGGKLRIDFLGEGVVKVRAGRKLGEERSWSVIERELKGVELGVKEDDSKLSIREGDLGLVVRKKDTRIEFWVGGKKFCINEIEFGKEGFSISSEMQPDEHYFGFGEKAKNFDKRGSFLVMRNRDPVTFNRGTDPLYLSVPFFLALRRGFAYGFFSDTVYESYFDMGAKGEKIEVGAKGIREANYYLIHGPKPADVLRKFTELTGRAPLPPLWSLGYHQSRFSYRNEETIIEIAREFRKKGIPLRCALSGHRSHGWL